MMYIFPRFIFAFFVLFPSLVLGATTSQFTISVQGGEDIEPPTTPTLLSVTPTAATQIDVVWSAATDNLLLGGYVLLRDGFAIATTTLTSFVDTGLLPETLYQYEVYAFDSSYNISTTSNALSTTTPAQPVAPPQATSTENGSSGTLVFRLLNLDITPDTNSALFEWETSMPARYALRWGRNDNYDEGYIINDIYRKEQQTLITDLEPGTTYLYELVGYAANGRVLELRSGQFSTVARENLTPANVQNFTATPVGNDVRLSYTTPTSVPNAVVRIVRSHLGYPLDPYDGAVVYEGKLETFLDSQAFSKYSTLYYTAFVISSDRSVSSGAIAKAVKRTTEPGVGEPEEPEVLPEEPIIELPYFNFSIEAISISQGEKEFTFKSDTVELLENEAFLISIKKVALPDNLKSIIVTLIDPTNPNRSYSFLLRINKEGDAYEAVIAPLLVSGPSRIQVEIYDYERSVIGRYRKAVTFVEGEVTAGEVMFPDKIVAAIKPFFSTISLLLLALLLLFFILYRRSKQAEDKQ